MTARTVTSAAHAKINLFLRVFGKDNSGFHGIETLFCLLELADDVSVTMTDSGVTIEVEGADTGPDENNIAVRAARSALQVMGNPFGVHIRIKKNIPVGGGLGGGSSDAAATLQCVNALADGRIHQHQLLGIGGELGSDVPFLVTGTPMALAWNRGERLFSVTPPAPKPVVLLVPDFGVNTGEAYRLLGRSDGGNRGPVRLSEDSFRTWGDIGRLGGNDFESVVFGKRPKLKEQFLRLANTSPILARMSGSGSTLYGIYRDENSSTDARDILSGTTQTVLTSTRDKIAQPPSVLPSR